MRKVLVGPALPGAGTPVFGGPSPMALRLPESRVLDGSQIVLIRYAAVPV